MIDYKLMENDLYKAVDKLGWKLTLTGEGLDVTIDINTGVHKGITYCVYLNEDTPVYNLYKSVFTYDTRRGEDFNEYEIGDYDTVGKLLRKIRALDKKPD